MISIVQLGTVDYALGLELQQRLVELRIAGKVGDILLLLEHPPVITLGRNARRSNVLASDELLAEKGVELCECNRGGDVTFHGPGQLVGYPIFDLRGFKPRLGAVEFVRKMEESLIRTCSDYEIATGRICGLTGVWTQSTPTNTDQAKVAAIGVHISRGVTSHGFALNVNNDLEFFKLIIPCGLEAKPVISIAKLLGHEVALYEVAESVARNFGEVFGVETAVAPTLDDLLGHPAGVPMKPPLELQKLRGESADMFA